MQVLHISGACGGVVEFRMDLLGCVRSGPVAQHVLLINGQKILTRPAAASVAVTHRGAFEVAERAF